MAGKQNGETFVKFVKVHPQISVSDADATDDTGVLEQTIEETDQAKRKNVRFSTLRPTSTELGGTHGEPVNNNLHGWRSPHDAPQAHRRQSFDNLAPNFPGSRSHVSWSSTPGSSHAMLDVGGSERHRRASIISQIDDIFSTQPLGEVSGVRRKSSVRDDKPFLSRFNQSLQEFKRIEIAKTEVRRSLSRVSTILCGLAIIAVCLMVVDLEYYNIKTRDLQEFFPNTTSTVPVWARCKWADMPPSFTIVFILKIAISVDSVLTVAALYYFYYKQCRMLIIKHHLPETATVLTSPLRGYYLVELFVCAFHVPPLLDTYVPAELQLLIFLRFYLTARYMREHNEMAKSKSTRFLASVMQTELQSSFLIKSYFLKHPFVMIFIFYCLNIFGVGYAVFAFDRASSRDNHYNTFQDSVWMLVVTMTTLGFGDVAPESLLGRTLVGISSIFGIFLMALLISVIHEGLTLTQQEKRILAYVDRQEFMLLRKDYAARCIQATWKLYRHGKKKEQEERQRRRKSMIHSLVLAKSQDDIGRQLKFQLYNALYNWRAVRKGREDHWVREFVSDNTAILLTDVARKIELIEEQLVEQKESQLAEDELKSSEGSHQELHSVPHTVWRAEDTLSDGSNQVIGQPAMVLVKPVSTSSEEDMGCSGLSTAAVLRQINALDVKLEEMYHGCKSELHALHSLVTTMSANKKVS